MIDFDRKPTKKNAQEQEFDTLNKEYAEKFGSLYVFSIGVDFMTLEEALSDIRQRIATNNPQPAPDYEPGNVY